MNSSAIHSLRLFMLLMLAGFAPAGHVSAAPTLWTGPTISFSKPIGADPDLPQNQDQLTALVAFTRGFSAGLYNAVQESGYYQNSPADTLWATDISSPGQTIDFANLGGLAFTTWRDAYGGPAAVGYNIVDRDAIVHLVSDDVYLKIRFTSWGVGYGNGAFAYQRSTPPTVPELATVISAAIGLLTLGVLRHRR